jgi:RNA polymerase I-specific transcription initiation factor RRN3
MVSLASTESQSGLIAPSAGGSLKRKQADSDFDAISLTQVKRQRVTFNPSVDVHILPDVNEKSLELVGEEVRRALEKHAVGDNASYDEIRALLSTKPTSPDAPLSRLLEKYVIALTNNVPLLDQKCTGLVHAIIDSTWITRNEHYYRSYRSLLRSLLSVQPGYIGAVLGMLVNKFVELPSPALRSQDDPAISRFLLHSRVHDCLRYLVRQISMASSILGGVIASKFPFPTDSAKIHIQYIKDILRFSDYCPELKGQIYSLVTENLVKIDVQVQLDFDELEDDLEDQLVEEGDNDVEEDDDDVSDNDSVSSEDSLDPEEQRLKDLKESVSKLDSIMDLLFSHYDSVFAQGDLVQIDETFESLLSQFANIILPTYRSLHTQFILFHFCQRSPDFMERFAGCCSHLAFDAGQPHILRVSAAAYLASFIARGAHVSSQVVRDVFDLLCHHLETLRQSQEPGCKGPNLRRYSTYYAISQALLYIFCFRWRDLIITEDDSPLTDEQVQYHEGDFTWYNNIQKTLHRNIFSKLNPLKICAPVIVNQFARMAFHLKFIYVFPLLETNKRIRLARTLGSGYMDGVGSRETALTMKKGEESFLLDAYFPFDPYRLPRSKRWVEGDYVQWRPVPGMQQPKDEDEDDEDDEEDEEDDIDEESDSEPEEAVDEDEELDDDVTEAST